MQILSVNFHYLREQKPKSGIYPLNSKEFVTQLDELAKYYEFISQTDLIQYTQSEYYPKKKFCLLTFDDGLKEQMCALQILNQKGIPGVFFVNSSPLISHTVLNVHKVHYIRSILSDKEVLKHINQKINLSHTSFPKNINTLYRYDDLEAKKLKYILNFGLANNVKAELIDNLFNQLTDECDFSKRFYMNVDDIKRIAQHEYLGTHGHKHTPLATLDRSGIKNDIYESLNFFHEHCGPTSIKSISYPHGGPKAVSNEVAKISRDFGMKYGLTMFRGINKIDHDTNLFLLKRVDTNDAPGGRYCSKEFIL